MATPEFYWISFSFTVYHKGIHEHEGLKVPVPGVSIVISREVEDKIVAIAKIVTDKNGKASWYNGGSLHKSFNYHFFVSKTGFESIVFQGYYEEGQNHDFPPFLLEELGWEPPPPPPEEDRIISKATKRKIWEGQEWQDRAARSFIMALAIILTFKFLQGFSMERVNPL